MFRADMNYSGFTDREIALSEENDRLRERLEKAENACRVAYRQMSGDYTDGGQYRSDREVIQLLAEIMASQTCRHGVLANYTCGLCEADKTE